MENSIQTEARIHKSVEVQKCKRSQNTLESSIQTELRIHKTTETKNKPKDQNTAGYLKTENFCGPERVEKSTNQENGDFPETASTLESTYEDTESNLADNEDQIDFKDELEFNMKFETEALGSLSLDSLDGDLLGNIDNQDEDRIQTISDPQITQNINQTISDPQMTQHMSSEVSKQNHVRSILIHRKAKAVNDLTIKKKKVTFEDSLQKCNNLTGTSKRLPEEAKENSATMAKRAKDINCKHCNGVSNNTCRKCGCYMCGSKDVGNNQLFCEMCQNSTGTSKRVPEEGNKISEKLAKRTKKINCKHCNDGSDNNCHKCGCYTCGSKDVGNNQLICEMCQNLTGTSKSVPEKGKEISAKLAKRTKEICCKHCNDMSDDICRECGCYVCGGKDARNKQLFCEMCCCSTHFWCLIPPIEVVPEGDWFCDDCNNFISDVTRVRKREREKERYR